MIIRFFRRRSTSFLRFPRNMGMVPNRSPWRSHLSRKITYAFAIAASQAYAQDGVSANRVDSVWGRGTIGTQEREGTHQMGSPGKRIASAIKISVARDGAYSRTVAVHSVLLVSARTLSSKRPLAWSAGFSQVRHRANFNRHHHQPFSL